MPEWISILLPVLLTVLIGLVGFVAKLFAKRLDAFEHEFKAQIGDLKLAVERSARHEGEIAQLRDHVTELRVALARLQAN